MVVQDPVTHHSQSMYNAFDNNPVFWADPSGADAVYNWDDGTYYDDEKEVTFEQALASHGINNSSESEETPPTKFVTESGEEIVETDDGSDEVYVVREENEDKFIANLTHNINLKKDKNKKENDKLGERYGYNLDDHLNNVDEGLKNKYGDYGTDKSNEREIYFRIGYNYGFSGKNAALYQAGSVNLNSASAGYGKSRGESHRKLGRMHAYEPKLSNSPPKYKIDNGSIVKNKE